MTRLFHLRTTGSPYDAGFAHGEACRLHGAGANLLFFARFLETAALFSAPDPARRAFRRALVGVARRFAERGYVARATPDQRATLRGFAAGSGIPLAQVEAASVMPDAYMYFSGLRARWLRLPPTVFGCTAFVRGDGHAGWTHGRNLDFPAAGTWLENPAVIEFERTGGQRVASVTALGVETSGVTAMNGAGLTLSLNMNYTRNVALGRVPVTQIGAELIAHCRDLDDASNLLRGMRPGAGWTFLVGSARERRAALFEMDGRDLRIHEMEGAALWRTNHYADPALRAGEYWISPRRRLDTRARDALARNALDTGKGDSLLSCVAGDGAVSQIHTLTSLRFLPDAAALEMAVGPAPLAQNASVRVSLWEESRPSLEVRTIGHAAGDPGLEARRAFARAYAAYFPARDWARCRAELARAVELDPAAWGYPFFAGMVEFLAGDVPAAERWFARAAPLAGDEDSAELRRLFRARAADAAGRRGEALALYGDPAPDSLRGGAFRAGRRRPFSRRDLRKLFLDFTVMDVVEL